MRRLLLACLILVGAAPALAIDFRSVGVPAAVLYDAPSRQAKKLYLIKAQTPVEVVVRLEGWVKVRDVEGTLAWIEGEQLAERRTLIVTEAGAGLFQAAADGAPSVASLEKWVVLDYVGTPLAGWVAVKHRDGLSGFVRATQVWGL